MKVQLFLTEKCNLKCKYCFEGEKGFRSMNILLLPQLIKFIRNYVQEDFVLEKNIHINFNGGEALLESNLLVAFTEEFKKNNISSFSISTNFTKLNLKTLDYLIENNFIFQISIDGDKQTHDMMRVDMNGNGTFDTVLKNINKLRKRYPLYTEIYYSMVVTADTVHNLFNNISFLFNEGFYNLICSYNAYDRWTKKSYNIFSKELSKITKLYIQMYEQGYPVSIKLLTQSITDFLSGIGKSECGACRDMIGILPNGDVLTCGAFIGAPDFTKYYLGSIFTGINYELISTYLKAINSNYALCERCVFAPRCHNKCFACSYRCNGNMYEVPISLCEINKICIKQADIILNHMIKNKNKTFYNKYAKFLQ